MGMVKDLWLPASLSSQLTMPASGNHPRFGAAPSLMTTSGIFSSQLQHVKRKVFVPSTGREPYTEQNRINGPKGCDIYQLSGLELRQAEGNIYYQLLLLALQKDETALETSPIGTRMSVYFSRNVLLERIGSGVGGSQVDALVKGLNLMGAAVFRINRPGLGVEGTWQSSLLSLGTVITASDTHYGVFIDAELAKLFAKGVTRLDLIQRAKLNDNLSRWLHGYYSTHEEPFPIKVESLRLWSGRENQQASKFFTSLLKALDELSEITGWSYDINDRLVCLDRGLSKRRQARKDRNGYKGSSSTLKTCAVGSKTASVKPKQEMPTLEATTREIEDPFVQRAAWLASLGLDELKGLTRALGALMGDPDASAEEEAAYLRNEFMGWPKSLAELKDKLAQVQPAYPDI